MRAFLAVIASLFIAFTLSARKQRTGPARLVPEQSMEAVPVQDEVSVILSDTLHFPSKSHLRFSGYDKPNRATRETFFVTNNLSDSVTVQEINVSFTYMDMQGRMLHKQSHQIQCEIPPGQTRKLSVRSWDTNNAFHYYRSPAPKRRTSTRYKVTSEVIFVLVLH